ncbi:metal-dependent hydrolase [Trinickia caryophylli]|nr:metal-dependent hydrolase [Trinickia caryophylli]TRX15458.1 metal-dependent hydrolase [Trinickia caryophylli]
MSVSYSAFARRWLAGGPRLWQPIARAEVRGPAQPDRVAPSRTAASASGARVHWNGSLVRTRAFDALSLLLPAGETFMIATLSIWRAQMGSALAPRLRAEVGRFIREEQAHQRVHERYNAALVADLPLAAAAAQRASRAADSLAALDMRTKLALVAAFEHLTALVSREIVEHRNLLVHDASPESRMWRWHAREEIGHYDVAMEVAAYHGLGRARRMFALMVASAFLMHDVLCATIALCRCDIARGARRRAVLGDALRFACASLPSVWRMAGGWWRYVATRSPKPHGHA